MACTGKRKTTAEMVKWLRDAEKTTYAMIGLTPSLSEQSLVNDFTQKAKMYGDIAARLIELEQALEALRG